MSNSWIVNNLTGARFIGGSDARIIMGADEAAWFGFGGRSEGRSNPRTSPAS